MNVSFEKIAKRRDYINLYAKYLVFIDNEMITKEKWNTIYNIILNHEKIRYITNDISDMKIALDKKCCRNAMCECYYTTKRCKRCKKET